ncbi:cytochrome c oxidase assembly protein [Streptomyces aureocirculatus]|uniref:cytochrome c oxidase assembly protein n=1 Tax=Streptomyces aureocirculatus TaxID=67275 RepID=UPI00068BA054|nr:cytochrome c oxidase assembly protein [Streptomyces aureocirculatus]
MTPAHVHPAPFGAGVVGPVVAVAVLLVAAAYLLAAARLRHRGDRWPWPRDVSFTAGSAAVLWAVVGSLPGEPFTAHSAQHLTVAMAAPLLLVLARPLTLALRALPPCRARRALLAVLHARPAQWLMFPPLAALLDVGGLWALYRTPLFAAADEPVVHALVQAHTLAAGLLFTFAVCQLDPVRRRWGTALRGATLLAAGAAHAVLAKSLYATPPPGTAFTTADLRTGAQLMYYGGDLVEVGLALTLAVRWYVAGNRLAAGRGLALPRRGVVQTAKE